MPTNDELREWLDDVQEDVDHYGRIVSDIDDKAALASFRSLLDREEALADYIKAVDGLVEIIHSLRYGLSVHDMNLTDVEVIVENSMSDALSAVESARAKLGEK